MTEISNVAISTEEQAKSWDGKEGSELLMAGWAGGLVSEGFYQSDVEQIKAYYEGRKMPRAARAYIEAGFKPTHREVWTWHAQRSFRNEGAYYLEKADIRIEELK